MKAARARDPRRAVACFALVAGAGWSGALVACGSTPASEPVAASDHDGGIADGSAPVDAGGAVDGDASAPDVSPPAPLSRGMRWVRHNPMFISGLTVGMTGADAPAASAYLDAFHANAVHTWATGLPDEIGAWQGARPGVRWVSWVDLDGKSVANQLLLGGTDGGVAGRIGYQVGDEPPDQAAYDRIIQAVGAIRAVDQDALTIVNYTGSPDPSFLDQHATIAKADVYSYDNYTRHKDTYASLGAIRSAGLKYGLPYWRYLRAYVDTGGTPLVDESDCRWDAMSGLVYGFTGHTWFVYQSQPNPDFTQALFSAPGSFSAPETPLFATVAQLNRELANVGRAITQLTSTDVRYVPATSFLQPGGTTTWTAGAGGDPFVTSLAADPASGAFAEILAGFFVDDAGDRYVIIQNPRHAHAEFPITGTQPLVARVAFDFGASGVDATKVLALSPTTGDVEDVALASDGGAKAHLDVTLDAGHVLLFKYATGRSFALGPP